MIVALDSAIYDNGKYCGQSLTITNTATGATAQAVVADECPTCDSSHSLDMSQALFEALDGSLANGEFDSEYSVLIESNLSIDALVFLVKWYFNN